LKRYPNIAARVFVVWEPILSTDWSPPSTFALNRIPDARVQQYWDPDHIVATKLAADRRGPQPKEDCCERSGFLWDLVAVYPVDPIWTDRLPIAILFNGPVVDVKEDLDKSFAAAGVSAKRRFARSFTNPQLTGAAFYR
jgi:hypothetical protein